MRRGKDAAARDYLLAMAPRLRGYLRVLLADPQDAEDVLQEAFLRFLAKGPEPGAAEADAWLFAVCRSAALNFLRDRPRRKARQEACGAAGERAAADPASPGHSPASPGRRPAEAAGQGEAVRRIEACMNRLPLELREALYLKVAGDLSVRQIAEQTGTPKSTVAIRIREGLILLNRLFRAGG